MKDHRPLYCFICLDKFSTHGGVTKHLGRKHLQRIKPGDTIRCPRCDVVLESKMKLQSHAYHVHSTVSPDDPDPGLTDTSFSLSCPPQYPFDRILEEISSNDRGQTLGGSRRNTNQHATAPLDRIRVVFPATALICLSRQIRLRKVSLKWLGQKDIGFPDTILEYLVAWRYTWQPRSDLLPGCEELVIEFSAE
ncbi:hypothetical protein AJ78_08055 [Emergomyces pasteurianus Ep9510]|uniref:Chromo domain-containing protein n=1 Tax=Emergomyces pasteurianus Ep9510 TaxID=1447872 RepID=A0A1J9P2W3_9EURO|nr:hypothetical protein AJ78_08055 [Emergomyces pasteurianus Ep9510]